MVRPSHPQLESPVHGERRQFAWALHGWSTKRQPLCAGFYQTHEATNQVIVEPIRAQDHALTTLATKEYDVVEFFCHGHTKLDDVFSAEDVKQLLDSYATTAAGGKRIRC